MRKQHGIKKAGAAWSGPGFWLRVQLHLEDEVGIGEAGGFHHEAERRVRIREGGDPAGCAVAQRVRGAGTSDNAGEAQTG